MIDAFRNAGIWGKHRLPHSAMIDECAVVRRYWVARSHCVCLEGHSVSEPDFALVEPS
jgi:hypothetical protein